MFRGIFNAYIAKRLTVREYIQICIPKIVFPVLPALILLFSQPTYLSADNFTNNDTILENGIRSLMDTYFENYTLYNEHGVYEHSRDLRFRWLFDDDAMIFNFLPGTNKSNRNISIDEYLATVRNDFQDKIIRPGMYTWYIFSASPLAGIDNTYLVEVIMQKRILFFDQRDMHFLSNDDWELNTRIRADLNNMDYKILDIRNLVLTTTDLNIRMIYPNREPARLKPIEFEYYDPVLKKKVVRKRVTDQGGMVSLAGISVSSPIKVYSSERRKVFLPVRLTAGQWNELPPNNRFVVLGEKARYIRKNKENLLSIGAQHHFPMISPMFFTRDTLASVFPSMDYMPGQDIFIHYSRMFLNWRRFGISAGTGVEYQSYNLSTLNEQRVYFVDKSDDDLLVSQSDTLVKNINTESYDFTGISVPLSLNLNYFSHNRFFTGVRAGVRSRYLVFNQHNYSFQTDSISSLPGSESLIPDFEMSASSGSFKQNTRFVWALDMAFLFNIYKDMLHLQSIVSYNFQNTGNQGMLYKDLDEDNGNTPVYIPFLNRNELRFNNFSLGLGVAFRF